MSKACQEKPAERAEARSKALTQQGAAQMVARAAIHTGKNPTSRCGKISEA